MSENFLTRYVRQSMTPEARVEAFVFGEPRLTWISLLFTDHPTAEIYLVGGTLRDALLGRLPHDLDLVIRNLEPERLEYWLTAHGACDFVGKRFGTFKFVPHGLVGSEPIDIALPRTERVGREHSSGRADLEIQSDYRLSIKDDLARRDFTINAMAYDLKFGRLIDPHLGLHDLDAGLIRAVLDPDERFFEDATRLLRALRLASELYFGIEQITWQAILNNTKLLNNKTVDEAGHYRFAIPREAIGKEFLLGFIAHPTHTLDLWQQSQLLNMFMPELAALEKVIETDSQSAFDKTKAALCLLKRPDFLHLHHRQNASASTLIATLMSFIENDHAQIGYRLCRDFYFHQFPPGHRGYADCREVMWLLEHLHVLREFDPASMRPSHFEKIFLGERGHQLLLLIHAHLIASGQHSVERERLHIARRLVERFEADLAELGIEKMPKLVSGHDIEKLGLSSGPIYRDLIDQIRDAQLAHRIRTRDEALTLLQGLVKDL